MATRTDTFNWDQTSGMPWHLFGGTALTKLEPGLGDAVSQCREAGSLFLPCRSWKCVNVSQLGHEGSCSVPGSESQVDQAVMWGNIMTKWKLGFLLVSVFLHLFPRSLGSLSALK